LSTLGDAEELYYFTFSLWEKDRMRVISDDTPSPFTLSRKRERGFLG
jgi:hypothetical protein